MKKVFLSIVLIFSMALTVKAEREGVFMRYYKYSDTETNNEVNRSLICIPVYVFYNSETGYVDIISEDESLNGEVYLYNLIGDIEEYSSSINTSFRILLNGRHIIRIEGDGWYAEGEIEV